MISCPNCKHICDEQLCICPGCHYAMDNKPVRVAQYGGVGGGKSQSWQPGASPNSRGSTGGGQFSQMIDQSLNAIMGLTRTNVDDDETPDASIEHRLEKFHTYFEIDKIPELPFKERQELKKKQNDQRRQKFLDDSNKSVYENSPAYIKQNFHPKPEQLIPMENSLDDVRTNDEYRTSLLDDIVYILDSSGNQRAAATKIAAPKIRHNVDTVFGPHDDTEEDVTSNYADDAQMSHVPLGNSGNITPMFSSKDVDNYLSGEGLDQLNGFLKEQTLLDWPNADEVHMDGEYSNPITPSPVSDIENPNNVNDTIESQLGKLKNQEVPVRQPNIPGGNRNMDEIKGQEGTADKYNSPGNTIGMPSSHPSI